MPIQPVSSRQKRRTLPSKIQGQITRVGKGPGDFLSSLGQNANFKRPGDERASYEPNKQVRDFQPYGVGKPKYGAGRSMPNVGPVTGREGYRERDLKNQVMKNRMMKKLKNRKIGGSPTSNQVPGAKTN